MVFHFAEQEAEKYSTKSENHLDRILHLIPNQPHSRISRVTLIAFLSYP